MIKTLMVAARDRNRLAEITSIATRYGLDVLLVRLGLEAKARDVDGAMDADTLPHRTRLALEALGPTFVKLGQILATRADLLPPHWIAELEHLHSRAPTLPFETLRPEVELALGQPPEAAFASFDATPLAAASMAQVHKAVLADGRPVVLKIRRPGIRPVMEADLRLIAHLATIVENANADARRFAPVAMVRQLAQAVLEELDFSNEGRNADRLRDDFSGNEKLVVPEIHWEWTSEALLVMDYVDGVPPRDGDTLRAAGIDPAEIASLSADVVLDMVLINGRFHADPHPGNLLCLPGNRLALLDLGMIGHVSPRRREEFLSFVQSLTSGDPGALADTLAIWSKDSGVPRDRILLAAEQLVARHGGQRLILSAMVADFLPLLRNEGLVLPPDLLLIFKALVTVDGVLAGIEPGFDLSAAMRRSYTRILAARLSPGSWGPALGAVLWEIAKVGDDAPRLIRAAVQKLESGPAKVDTSEKDIAQAIAATGRWVGMAILLAGATIGFGVIVAAFLR
ncbi:MAG: AarF/UbiB family protein [Pseudomonadota bacterium]|uniref:ABC1 kinase family protein n=1 Tax=Sphingomonas sp. ERG5 TaxID=1381597 RepID=UPI00054B298C|nr:AarF/UbiB family protein [Sphingomonas sp. ERG5]